MDLSAFFATESINKQPVPELLITLGLNHARCSKQLQNFQSNNNLVPVYTYLSLFHLWKLKPIRSYELLFYAHCFGAKTCGGGTHCYVDTCFASPCRSGAPNYGPRAKTGLWSHFIRPL